MTVEHSPTHTLLVLLVIPTLVLSTFRQRPIQRYHKKYLIQTFSSPTNALVEFIKTRLKLGRLLQHVSVYKETIIREPVSA